MSTASIYLFDLYDRSAHICGSAHLTIKWLNTNKMHNMKQRHTAAEHNKTTISKNKWGWVGGGKLDI